MRQDPEELEQHNARGRGEKWPLLGYILKGKPQVFSEWSERKREVRDESDVWPAHQEERGCH